MLTGRAKAYSISRPQAVTHRSTKPYLAPLLRYRPKIANFDHPPLI